MKYIILVLILTGCGNQVQVLNYPVPSDIQPYVTTFETMYGFKVPYIQYAYADLPAFVLGECQLPSQVVTVANAYWSQLDETQREQLILHELGHCVLNRAHQNGVFSDGHDLSLMNAYELDEQTYTTYHSYYMTELFILTNEPMLGIAQVQTPVTYVCK